MEELLTMSSSVVNTRGSLEGRSFEGVLKGVSAAEPRRVAFPLALQELLPGYLFKAPKVESGVYLIYQPFLHKVYVRQAKNISTEVSSYLSTRVSSMENKFKEAIEQYGRDSFLRISVCSDKDFNKEAERLLLETKLIIQLQEICYNRKENPLFNGSQKKLKVDPKLVIKDSWETVEYVFVSGSRETCNLSNIIVFPPAIGKSSIYLMINLKTFNF